MEETVYSSYQIKSSQRKVAYIVEVVLIFILSFTFFFSIFIVLRSTNIILLVVSILIVIFSFSQLPAFFASRSAFGPDQAVKLTSLGIHFTDLTKNEGNKFLAWEKIKQYDIHLAVNKGVGGVLFPKPSRIELKTGYEEDTLVVDAFEEASTLIALLKEHNIPFGFSH
jgi:hypothetical protein